jgi:ABC-type uncharacterized transport system substrate-binding protein
MPLSRRESVELSVYGLSDENEIKRTIELTKKIIPDNPIKKARLNFYLKREQEPSKEKLLFSIELVP